LGHEQVNEGRNTRGGHEGRTAYAARLGIAGNAHSEYARIAELFLALPGQVKIKLAAVN
jgi:hypothetical protein